MFRDTVLYHMDKYPLMEITDLVKLAFQNEFGPGHLILNPDNARMWLEREYNSVKGAGGEPTVDIGNGLVRVNLSAVDESCLEHLFDSFCRSARKIKGSVESFERKLDILRAMADDGVFPFTRDALDKYLTEYKEAGYPPVSHSESFRQNYKPSYRVVLRRLYE